MKWSMLVVIFLAATLALAADTKEPAALAKARKDYEDKIKAAVDPITTDYLAQLDKMKKAFGAQGDLESALAVEKEIKSLTTAAAGPTLVGKWSWPGGAIQEFKDDGTFTNTAGGRGTWKCIDKKARKYQALANGVDSLVLSADGTTLIIRSNRETNLSMAQRVQEP